MLKVIAGLIVVGTMGSIEVDTIGFWQATAQLALGASLFVIAEQSERISQLKQRMRRERDAI